MCRNCALMECIYCHITQMRRKSGKYTFTVQVMLPPFILTFKEKNLPIDYYYFFNGYKELIKNQNCLDFIFGNELNCKK